jgi:hypothetical protein
MIILIDRSRIPETVDCDKLNDWPTLNQSFTNGCERNVMAGWMLNDGIGNNV